MLWLGSDSGCFPGVSSGAAIGWVADFCWNGLGRLSVLRGGPWKNAGASHDQLGPSMLMLNVNAKDTVPIGAEASCVNTSLTL